MLRLRSWASSTMIVSYAREQPVAADLGEQDPVGHDLDQRRVADRVGEAHRVPDGVAQADVELFGEPLGHRPGRDPPRLGVADHAVDAPTELEAHLRDLGGLARSGLARHHHHLVVPDGREDLLPVRADREVVGVADRGRPSARAARRASA